MSGFHFSELSPELILDALASVGLTLAMESDVRDDIDAGRLVRVLEDWTPTLPPLSLYYPSRRQNLPAFKVIVEALRFRG